MPNEVTDTLSIQYAWGGQTLDQTARQITIPAEDRQFIAGWRDSYFVQGTIIMLVMILLLSIKKIVAITPNLLGALVRVKEILNLEETIQLSIIRNQLAAISVLSLSILLTRFRVMTFLPGSAGAELSLAMTLGVMILIAIYRYATNKVMMALAGKDKPYNTLRKGSYTYFILACAACYIVLGTLYICGFRMMEPYRLASTITLATVWLIYIIREIQIFYQYSCTGYFSFLYLCILEFVPIGVITLLTVIL